MTAGSKSIRGFSLTELVITLLIAGILASLAMPSFVRQIKQDRVVNNANYLSAFYKYSRSEAVKQAKTLHLVASSSKWLLQSQTDGEWVTVHEFSVVDDSIEIEYADRTITSTGEVDQALNLLVTDNDDSTTDYRLCVLQSGQSWVDEADKNCA
ncbi:MULTISPECIES: pilus assembly FimT family protein [Pseudoalteromonas]|uniref:Type II secretion system protein GspH n=1 Tax=Pseudoalteromonas amylolytica TaxID=1859457 RepID=A0A1S1MSM3_9GAMM|nr:MULTISPECIES: prepilin-type N-terminal cleavage/methylation domain-containing protein [Pseudoalteromonas]OHU86168.1 type II secretion system protein GspH [Pseudoalteromonas sp. JW3]OHU89725.1 type II secretion system protein GspH [Pseudoalteromonas amylolytica]